jgi:hypothetical protein
MYKQKMQTTISKQYLKNEEKTNQLDTSTYQQIQYSRNENKKIQSKQHEKKKERKRER